MSVPGTGLPLQPQTIHSASHKGSHPSKHGAHRSSQTHSDPVNPATATAANLAGVEAAEQLEHLMHGHEVMTHNPDLQVQANLIDKVGAEADSDGDNGKGGKKRNRVKTLVKKKEEDEKKAAKASDHNMNATKAPRTDAHGTLSRSLSASMRGKSISRKPLEAVDKLGVDNRSLTFQTALNLDANLKYLWVTQPEKDAQRLTDILGNYARMLPEGTDPLAAPTMPLSKEDAALVAKARNKLLVLDFSFETNRQSYKEKQPTVTVRAEAAEQFLAATDGIGFKSSDSPKMEEFESLRADIQSQLENATGDDNITFSLTPKQRVAMNDVTKRLLPQDASKFSKAWNAFFSVFDLASDVMGGPVSWIKRGAQSLSLPFVHQEVKEKGFEGAMRDQLAEASLKKDSISQRVTGSKSKRRDAAIADLQALFANPNSQTSGDHTREEAQDEGFFADARRLEEVSHVEETRRPDTLTKEAQDEGLDEDYIQDEPINGRPSPEVSMFLGDESPFQAQPETQA